MKLLRNKLALVSVGLLLLALLAVVAIETWGVASFVVDADLLQRPPRIDPDYTSLVIPPNIAPLNFRITEDADDYIVRITSDAGPSLTLKCSDGTCRIPRDAWRRMLDRNRGMEIHYDVQARKPDGSWVQFSRFTNRVAGEPIDPYIVYRLLLPDKSLSHIKGIFQRDLESFETSALVTTRDGTFACFNCHTFHQHNPNRFLIHVRMQHPGMVLVLDDEVRTINTKQSPMFRPLAYASWHPDGVHIAATMNWFFGYHPSDARLYYFEAVEKRGDLVVYNVEANTVSTTKEVFENEYIETHPCWSPDGKYIYFVRCKDAPLLKPEDLSKFRFDLMRVACDVDTDTWGSPEMVMAYSERGTSCSFPRPSPDGRHLLHILADETTYPIHQQSSDLYLLDLPTKVDSRLDSVNSDRAESYPRWSSNGRWFSFVSNRRDGLSALPYFAYLDEHGEAHKAFVLPQKDPAYYDTFIDTYNVVEMVSGKVNIDPFTLAREMQRPARDARFPNPPEVDAYTGATPQETTAP